MNKTGIYSKSDNKGPDIKTEELKASTDEKVESGEHAKPLDGNSIPLSPIALNYIHLFTGLIDLDKSGKLFIGDEFKDPFNFSQSKHIDLSKVLPEPKSGEQLTANKSIKLDTMSDQSLGTLWYDRASTSFINAEGSVTTGVETVGISHNIDNIITPTYIGPLVGISESFPGASILSTLSISLTGIKAALNANGSWTYVANSAFDSLNVGDSVSDSFNVVSSDGTTTTVQVTINGTNDAAQLSSAAIVLTETDAVLSTSGTLTISDVDNPNTFVAQTNVAGTNGTFSIDANGAWTYVANSAFDSLNVGDSVSDSFNVVSPDGTTTTVQVTINGTNDLPVVSTDVAGTVYEGGNQISNYNVLSNDSDVDGPNLVVTQFARDANGTNSFTANGMNAIITILGGIVLMNSNGTFTYTPPASVDHTNNNTKIDSFFYKASDSINESTWTQVSINVTDTSPTAMNDFDTVSPGEHIFGNVITGVGVNGQGADALGQDSTHITSINYNGATYNNFVNSSITINAHSGTLIVSQDGSYHFTANATADIASAGGSNSMSSWTNSGIEVIGFSMGTPVFGQEYAVSISNKGLYINSPGNIDKNNYLDSSSGTQTETIVLNMKNNYSSLDLTLRDVNSNDQIAWKAYDANKQLVDSGVINNTSNGQGSQKEATFTIESDMPFQYLAIQGTDSNDEFTIWSISNALAVAPGTDTFSYTITDADNDTSTATLTISTYNPIIAAGAHTVYESGLDTGTNPGATDIVTTGNLFSDIPQQDDLSINSISFGNITAAPDVNGVINIDSHQGAITVYTETRNGHAAGDYIYALQAAGDPLEENFIYNVTDFVQGSNGDVLDLSNMLSDASPIAESLDQYLHISYQESVNGQPGESIIEVNPTGGEHFEATQTIALTGVDLTAGGTLNNQDIITDLLTNGNLVVDGQ